MVLSLSDPLFASYTVAAALMSMKAVSMSWLTVVRMTVARGGYRSPEDLRKTLLNPDPHPRQLEVDDYVERSRRIHQNDLESVPFFLATGFLFVATDPPLWLAQALFATYVVTRMLHFWAYLTAKTHDLRAAFWTPGSLILLFMGGWALVAGVLGLGAGGGG